MTQANPIIGSGKTGLEYRGADNDGKQALLNHHKGGSAPSYAEAGIVWLDDSATPWLLKIYDGADWVVLMAVNASTNAVTPYFGTGPSKLVGYAADTGAANAYVTAPVPALSAYAAGQIVLLKPGAANTGASTLAVSGLSALDIKMPDGGALPSGALTATGAFLLFCTGTQFTLLNPATGSAGVFWAVDQQASGTTPTSATAGAWTKRTLGTEKKNTVTGASLASSVVSLPAGTYEVDATVVVHNASGAAGSSSAARLRDVTNNVTLVMGTTNNIGLVGTCPAIVRGEFTLAGAADVELQYFCQATGAPRLGYATSNGDAEMWATLFLSRKA